MAAAEHPTREIVLPLAMVISLLCSALISGISYGKLSQKLETITVIQDGVVKNQGALDSRLRAVEGVVHDLQRDFDRKQIDDDSVFRAFDDYLRGHLGGTAYRTPPSSESLIKRHRPQIITN